MTAIANKKLMEEIFASAGNPDPAVRDRSLFVANLADDARWVVTGQYSWSRTFTGKESILRDPSASYLFVRFGSVSAHYHC